ncbi:MAG: CheR family methyltransferase [Pseudomonadota bacterium]
MVTTLNPAPLEPISDKDFVRFQQLIYEEAGIFLSPVKKALLNGRLARRLRELGLHRFGDYYQRIVEDRSGGELVLLLDAIATNETQFFREPRQFEYLEQIAYPVWEEAAAEGRRSRHIRIWSAACSSGEEPYSLAMSLLSRFPADRGWSIEILASDISTRVLARAEDGIWPVSRAAHIPEALLKRYMLRGTGVHEGKMKAGAEVRAPLRFARINLNDAHYPVSGQPDAIFCRNVLIYFNHASRLRVIHRLLDMLAPGGLLFLGHAESLGGMSDRVRAVAPAVYQRLPDERRSARA